MTLRLACVQMPVEWGHREANLRSIRERTREAAANGAQLVAFPEASLSGYIFDSREEAWRYAEPIPGPAIHELIAIAEANHVHLIVGMLEQGDENRLYNSAVLVGPAGWLGRYRKTHLPYLGVDRFVTPGEDPYRLFEVGSIRIGLLICYDLGFPEPARCLALLGADLIVLPTNWPIEAQVSSEYLANARALENTVYVATVDRIGQDHGVEFIGRSRIVGPFGRALADAPHANPTILYADIEPERARTKRIVREPGKSEVDRFAHRRPELYGPILAREI